MTYYKDYEKKLKIVMTIGGWTQKYVAEKLDMQLCNVNHLATGKSNMSKRFVISIRALIDYEKQFNEELTTADLYWPTMEELLGNAGGDPE